MALPQYDALGLQDIIATLEGPILIVTMNRAKEYVYPDISLFKYWFDY